MVGDKWLELIGTQDLECVNKRINTRVSRKHASISTFMIGFVMCGKGSDR